MSPTSLRPGLSWIDALVRVLLALTGLVALIRAIVYLAYAFCRFFYASPFFYGVEDVPIEAKMVHLAWRFQAGISLYPDWHDSPYVSNFFGPAFFVIVGGLGRALQANLDDLYVIGRLVAVVAALLTTLLVGLAVKARCGPVAGALAAAFSLGSRPMYGFSVMVRPDTTAELFGFAGFLLATSRRSYLTIPGCALLALAVLTKQTAGVFLIAAVITLLTSGRKRPALIVGAVTSLLLAVTIGGITLLAEPNFPASLLGESQTPWSLAAWKQQGALAAFLMPELVLFSAIGLIVWAIAQPRWPGALALTMALLLTCAITTAKLGSDANYLLSLRIPTAFALGSLWQVARNPASMARLRWFLLPATTIGLLAAPVGLLLGLDNLDVAREYRRHQVSTTGRQVEKDDKVAIRVAEDPSVRILTDSGFLDVRQKERTAFGDPWLFRTQVHAGAVHPVKMIADVEAERYDYVFTNKEIFEKAYEDFDYGLPMPVIEAVRRHYVLVGAALDFYCYRRRGASGPQASPLAPR